MERARLSLAPSPLGPLPPLAGPPPQCRLLPLPTPAPSSGPPSPTARTLRPQPQPGSPTPASASYPDPPGSESQYSPWPGYLGTLARTRGPGHRLAEGRAAVAAPGRGRVGERGGGGSRSSANAPGRGNRASDVSVGRGLHVTTQRRRGGAYVTATQRLPGAESLSKKKKNARLLLPDPKAGEGGDRQVWIDSQNPGCQSNCMGSEAVGASRPLIL